MREKEQLYFHAPREALQNLHDKGRRGILYDLDPHTRSPREELFVQDAEKKAAEYIDKHYSPTKTLEKVLMHMHFKQFAYLVMTDNELIQQMEEGAVRNTLRLLAKRREHHLDRSKEDLLRGLEGKQKEKNNFFIKREIDTLHELYTTLVDQGTQTLPTIERNPLPARTRR